MGFMPLEFDSFRVLLVQHRTYGLDAWFNQRLRADMTASEALDLFLTPPVGQHELELKSLHRARWQMTMDQYHVGV